MNLPIIFCLKKERKKERRSVLIEENKLKQRENS